MCGRVKSVEELNEVRKDLSILFNRVADYVPRYNTAPTDMVPVVTSTNRQRTLEMMRWGLVPSWAKDLKTGFATFNGRVDTIATKPVFRDAWKAARRCLVVTDGFYEWRKSDKQPFMIALGNKQPMLMAGLWEEWKPKDAAPLRSCTIITTDANAFMAGIHDRMPVILGPEDWEAWLGEEPLPNPAALLKPFPGERMTMWPVSKAVGNVKNQGAELAEPML